MTAAPRPWLSVLVPAHDVLPWIGPCLQALFDNIAALPADVAAGVELIVLDDASGDGTWPLIQSAQRAAAPPMRLLRHDHARGVGAARNSLLEAARGEYLWFVDSDDLLAQGAMAALHRIVAAEQPDIVLSDFSRFPDGAPPPGSLPGSQRKPGFRGPVAQLFEDRAAALLGLFRAGHLHLWSKVHRRALYGADLRYPEGRIYEDIALLPLLFLRAGRFFYTPEVWLHHRARAGSVISTPDAGKGVDKAQALLGVDAALAAVPGGVSAQVRQGWGLFLARHLRAIYRDLVLWPRPDEARVAYRALRACLQDWPTGSLWRLGQACVQGGRPDILLAVLWWRARARLRLGGSAPGRIRKSAGC